MRRFGRVCLVNLICPLICDLLISHYRMQCTAIMNIWPKRGIRREAHHNLNGSRSDLSPFKTPATQEPPTHSLYFVLSDDVVVAFVNG